jgi:transposase
VILLPRAVRIYLAMQPIPLNRSFDGLSNEVRQVLRQDPLSGHVFVFLNRRRTMAKLLLWTRGGFTIVHKRLEKGTFGAVREARGETHVEIDVHELSMLLEGVELRRVRVSQRWEPLRHRRAA